MTTVAVTMPTTMVARGRVGASVRRPMVVRDARGRGGRVGARARRTATRAGSSDGEDGDVSSEDMFEAVANEMTAETKASRDIEETVSFKRRVGEAAPTPAKAKADEDLVNKLTERVKDPQVVMKAAAGAIAAGTAMVFTSEPGAAVAGVGMAVLVVKLLELLAANPATTKEQFNASVKKELKPMLDKLPATVDKASISKRASETSSAVFDRAKQLTDSFDEVFSGFGIDGVKPVEETKPVPVEKAPEPVEETKPAPVEKAPEPVKPVEPVPVLAAAPAAPTPEEKKRVEEWENALLKLQYSEQIIEDIRVADANAVERAHARRLGLDFTPEVAKKMPGTEYAFADASSVQAGEVISALNSADKGYSSSNNRARSQRPPEKSDKDVVRSDEKPWWRKVMDFIVALMMFAAIGLMLYFVARTFM